MGKFIKPMLTTLVPSPFDDPNWLFETKWDGYRVLACVDGGVALYSRNGKSFNALFPELVQELSRLRTSCILDGEVVILDKKGKSHFQLMQNYQKTQEGDLHYYAFDLLFLGGKDLRKEPLEVRKKLLHSLLAGKSLTLTRYSKHVEEKGIAFFARAKKLGLEGIIAKRRGSLYRSTRGKDWLKIKTQQRQEVVIGGFTKPQGSRKRFGALLLGVYEKGELKFIGQVGTGFSEGVLEEVYQKMVPLINRKSPFSGEIHKDKEVTWIRPKLVAEVAFTEWTQGAKLRHPAFKGLRIDKKPAQVKREEKCQFPI